MTDELLKGMCAQAANMAKTELRYRHCLHGILATYFEGEGLRRMRSLERLAVEKAGPDWLDHGKAKDIIFGILRFGASKIPPEAIVIATVINDYRTTPAFDALPRDERERIFNEQYPSNYPQYLKPHDALMAVAQSPERACVFKQRLEGPVLIGDPEIMFWPQAEWSGRLKMYGVEPPSEIADTYAKMRATEAGE